MRVDVAKLFAEYQREQDRLVAIQFERDAARYLRGVEMAVLGAMLTRYDFELFADVEVDDFHVLAHKSVLAAIRVLEHECSDVDGEFLLSDVAAEIERSDRSQDKRVRDTVTDAFLRELTTPPAWVVPCRDRVAVSCAIDQLRYLAAARSVSPMSATDAVAIAARMRQLDVELGNAKPQGDIEP